MEDLSDLLAPVVALLSLRGAPAESRTSPNMVLSMDALSISVPYSGPQLHQGGDPDLLAQNVPSAPCTVMGPWSRLSI